MVEYKIREVNEDDVPFLWDMLYEICHTHWLRDGKEPPAREILQKPELAKYVQGWGRLGDKGFIAINTENQTSIGAAWYRLYPENDKAYGYVDDATPEISIAVVSRYVNKGIGRSLLVTLRSQARLDGYQQISLSVDPNNPPAFHLYNKLGFEKVGMFQTSWIMKKVLI
ncbi:MAG: GNAT family N-acetyltransferase [Nostocaceae cyanobacterium]|nr:GNAT family N-acetyltransferase [Nostocaceae cyanobacterium]